MKPNGYLEFTRGEHKGRAVHRVTAEASSGRRIRRGEHVHHADGDKTNNDPSNLEIMSHSQHSSLHAREAVKHRLRNEDGTWS